MTATDAAEGRRATGAAATGDGRPAGVADVPFTGWLWGTALARVAVAVTVLPIVVATVRGVARGWVPVSENALFQILARDVFSDHPPLLGLASSASLITGTDVHHPGPLLFDLLAPPVVLFGGPGVAIGVGLINVAAVIGIAAFVWRRGGPLFVAGAMAVVSALLWSMGSELLYEPWNPHAILLSFLCFLVLVWCSAAGDPAALPFAAVAGSVALQTHLSYSLLVPVLGLWGVAALLVAARRAPPGSDLRRRLRRAGPVALAVLLLCWAQPLGQQVFGAGPGNLTALLDSSGESGRSVGPELAVRMTARVVTEPPSFLRPSFREGWISKPAIVVEPSAADLPGLPFAVGSLLLLGAALGALLWTAHRKGDSSVVRLVVTALLALAVALVTVIQAPLGYFGIPMHLFRWLWAVAAFALLAVLLALLRRLPNGLGPPAALVLTVVAGALSVANLPTSDQGTIAVPGAIEAVEDLNGQLGPLEGTGPLLVDVPDRFGDPYGLAVMAELQRRDVPFVVQKGWERQVGPQRLLERGGAEAAVRVVVGDAARSPSPGQRRVAFHDGLGSDERQDLEEARAAVEVAVRSGRLGLNEEGREALDEGELPSFDYPFDDQAVERLVERRGLRTLFDEGWLEVEGPLAGTVERFVDLQRRADDLTVAVLLDRLTAEEEAGET